MELFVWDVPCGVLTPHTHGFNAIHRTLLIAKTKHTQLEHRNEGLIHNIDKII